MIPSFLCVLSLVPTARTPSSFLRDPGTLIWHRIVGKSPAVNCGDGRQERKDSRGGRGVSAGCRVLSVALASLGVVAGKSLAGRDSQETQQNRTLTATAAEEQMVIVIPSNNSNNSNNNNTSAGLAMASNYTITNYS